MSAIKCPRCKQYKDTTAHTVGCDMARLDRWPLDMGDGNTARVHQLETQLANLLDELAQSRRTCAALRMERDALRTQGHDLRALIRHLEAGA